MHNPAVLWMEEQVLHKRTRPCLNFISFKVHVFSHTPLRHTLILRHRSLAARVAVCVLTVERGAESFWKRGSCNAEVQWLRAGTRQERVFFFARAHFHKAAPLVNRIPAFLYSFRPTEWHALSAAPTCAAWKYILWAPALQVPPPALRRHVKVFSCKISIEIRISVRGGIK